MRTSRFWLLACFLTICSLLAACGAGAPAVAPTTAPAAAEATAAPAAAMATDAPTAAAAGATDAPTAAAAAATTPPTSDSATKPLPPDAAPPEQQVLVWNNASGVTFTSLDFPESVYNQGGFGTVVNVLSDPLVRLNKNFELLPAAATSWSSNADGTEWTFKLDPNLMWSDDTPVTAEDYATTFRYGADPKHAWDFSWYYSSPGAIKNWDDVVAGKKPLDELGVKAVDAHTLVITTEEPAPYLPAKVLYSLALQKKALEAHGGLYNSDPATSVSSGPFTLTEWKKGERLVYEANPKYKGNNKPYIRKVIMIDANPDTFFASYQANEVDYVNGNYLTPADNEIIAADPEMSKEVHTSFADFRTDYLFFDTTKPPFDNLKVRQAFSHVVDRDTIIKQILKPSQAIPAYSFLMPGFPASNSEGLKDIQKYDPDAARALLAEAGYPGGKGFPKLTLWLRAEPQVRQASAQAIAASLKQELGIEVEVSNKEEKSFMDALNAKPTQVQFGMVSYGCDFVDASNMLGVWLSGGRHTWSNPEFDKTVKEAAALVGDDAKRTKMFQDAEKIMVSDVPAVFINHRTRADIYRPYIKGSELEPDKVGNASLHWPDFSSFSASIGSIYISNEVTKFRPNPPE